MTTFIREPASATTTPRAASIEKVSSLASLRPAGPIERVVRGAVCRTLSGLRSGRLLIQEGGDVHAFGSPEAPLAARITVHDPAFWTAVALRGSVGAGESYVEGHWEADDLTTLIRIMVADRDVLDGMEGGAARLARPFLRFFHWLRDNTRTGSRRNIAAHYDLGNDFFSLFLDDTLTYSSGIFEHPGASMREASVEKYDRICRKLELKHTDHVVEIGSGWGGFAIHAASRYGCRVTTTTVSREQHALATERVAAAGIADRVTVLLEDYRDLPDRGETYDKLVSIEMVEAVGLDHLAEWFSVCERLLRPGGAMCVQAITISDHLFEQARRSVDFIQRHVFPGSAIPSVGSLATAAATTDLRVVNLEEIGPHYAETLRHWRERFTENAAEVRALGFPESFLRLWEFYLCYCEGGFRERAIGDVQILLHRPGVRSPAYLPGTRRG